MAKKKVLFVDDEPDMLSTVKDFLENTGNYEVRTESKGSKAYHAALQFEPNIIILDEMMPDRSGSEICSELESDEKLKDVPVVFLTGIIRPDEAAQTGGTIAGRDFLAKPVVLTELADFIEKHLTN